MIFAEFFHGLYIKYFKIKLIYKTEPDAEIGQISADFEMGRFDIGSIDYYYIFSLVEASNKINFVLFTALWLK